MSSFFAHSPAAGPQEEDKAAGTPKGLSADIDANGVPLPIDAHILSQVDEEIAKRCAASHSRGNVLRYVGMINESGEASLRMRELPRDHPFASLTGPELCINFTSTNYKIRPLTVQGPLFAHGTTTGAFTDFLTVARHLGAQDRPGLTLRKTKSMVRSESKHRDNWY